MPFDSGFFDSAGNPRIKIVVSGQPGNEALQLEPTIDTGFTGFLMISLPTARRLGITPLAAGTATLADGTSSIVQSGIGVVELSHEAYRGLVILAAVPEPLLGMEFLRMARKAVYVDRNTVAILGEVETERLRDLSS